MARLESLEAKAQGMQAYTMTLSDKLVGGVMAAAWRLRCFQSA